jgi:hypothetical protein
MTEQNTVEATEVEDAPQAPAVSYESIRDGVPGDAGASWRMADLEQTALRNKYKKLQEDARYSEEHKSDQAWAAFENAKEKIAAHRQQAREKLEGEARMAEHRSLPRPVGESLIATKNEDLLVAQLEAQRLDRRVQRLVDTPGPFNGSPNAVLREEYRKGLEMGGPEGRARCKGVLLAAEDRGISHEELLHPLRSEEHLEHLDLARRYREMTSMIGNNVPEPPFAKPDARPRGSDDPRRSPYKTLPQNRGTVAPGRKKSWSCAGRGEG